jgi:hypothetical protein
VWDNVRGLSGSRQLKHEISDPEFFSLLKMYEYFFRFAYALIKVVFHALGQYETVVNEQMPGII